MHFLELGQWCNIPTTYAGGAKRASDYLLVPTDSCSNFLCILISSFAIDLDDLNLVDKLSNGKVDLTFGSALDIFGGTLVKFDDLVQYNKNL